MKENKIIWALLATIISFIVYFQTIAPDVTFTDSGELAASCTKLGICHPTGYPLFTILGFIWTKILIGVKPVLSLNILAAIYTAISVFVFFFTVHNILTYFNLIKNTNKKNPNSLNGFQINLISFSSALSYAFALTIWEQANSIEVYSLQLLLFNLVIFSILKASIDTDENLKYYFLTAFLLGLSFSNHLTTILLTPAILFIYFKKPGEKFIFDKQTFYFLFKLTIPFLIGLSLYLYLPVRSAIHPEFNWGWVHRDLDKFLYHVTGKQYRIWMFTGDMDSIKKNFEIFFELFPWQLGWIGIIPLFYGFYYLFIMSKEIFWFFILLIFVSLIYTLNYSIHDISSYFSLIYIGLLLITAFGIFGLIQKKHKLLLAVFLIPVISINLNFSKNDKSNDYLVSDYTYNMINNLNPNAIIISSQWDYFCSAFWYKKSVEGMGKDIILIEKELLRRTWYVEQLKIQYPEIYNNSKKEIDEFLLLLEKFESEKEYDPQMIQFKYIAMLNSFIDNNFSKHPVYLTIDVLQSEQNIAENYKKIPQGFAFKLIRYNDELINIDLNKLKLDRFNKISNNIDNHLEKGIKEMTSSNLTQLAYYGMETNQYLNAKILLEYAIKINPDNSTAIKAFKFD